MNKGWLELESDPGLFTLLVEDFGVEGVQVEEIYDLQKPIEGQVYGFIFLFRWMEDRRARRKLAQEEESLVVDDKIINSMFFARQMIHNSCATHALLSVLLNCDSLITLGDTLTRLKQFTSAMSPEDKGYAIGNMPELAKAHNSHARPEPYRVPEKQQGVSSTGRAQEAFHFVSYVPVNGRLFELDGLKPYPVDHGPSCEKEGWTETFRNVIIERLGGEPCNDIRYSLMAVVPDKRILYEQKLSILRTNRRIVLEALQQMLKGDSLNEKSQSGAPIVTRAVALAAREAVAEAVKSKTSADECADTKPADMKPESDIKQEESSECETKSKKRGSKASCSDVGVKEESNQSSSIMEEKDRGGEGSSTDTASEADDSMDGTVSSKSSKSDTKFTDSANKKPKTSESGDIGEVDEGMLVCDDEGGRIDVTLVERYGVEAERRLRASEPEGARSDVSDLEGVTKGQAFTPKELLTLQNNLVSEISTYESLLKDEVEKRKRYKVDDCRRTHNYDQFIYTFLTMLAEQDQLAGLVQQHMLTKRRQGMSVGRLHRKSTPSSNKSNISDPRKRRGRRKR